MIPGLDDEKGRLMANGTCSVDGCEKPVRARGYCNPHYKRQMRYGDPLASARRPPIEKRFWSKVEKTESCWLWAGSIISTGYGNFFVGRDPETGRKVSMLAHRFSYELVHGAIPEGHVVDHKCYVHNCVNPQHLQAVDKSGNGQNRVGPQSNNKTGVLGVCWSNRRSKYIVQARVNGRGYYGGQYDDLAEAEAAAIALRLRVMTNNLADRRAS